MKLVKIQELAQITALSQSKIRQMISAGLFPPPVKFGRSSRWILDQVEAWISAQSMNRPAED